MKPSQIHEILTVDRGPRFVDTFVKINSSLTTRKPVNAPERGIRLEFDAKISIGSSFSLNESYDGQAYNNALRHCVRNIHRFMYDKTIDKLAELRHRLDYGSREECIELADKMLEELRD